MKVGKKPVAPKVVGTTEGQASGYGTRITKPGPKGKASHPAKIKPKGKR